VNDRPEFALTPPEPKPRRRRALEATSDGPATASRLDVGRALADAGAARASDAADRAAPDWTKRAVALLREFVAIYPGREFATEDFRHWAETERALEEPPDRRAYGRIVPAAIARGISIEKTGAFRASLFPECHKGTVRLWRAPKPASA
jgi:hypothetical protein